MTLNHSQIAPVNVWSAREHMTKVESKNLKRQITRLRDWAVYAEGCCFSQYVLHGKRD